MRCAAELLTRVESSGHGTGRLPTEILLTQPVTMPPRSRQADLAKVFDAFNERLACELRVQNAERLVERSV
jgi:hypothetical protein